MEEQVRVEGAGRMEGWWEQVGVEWAGGVEEQVG